MFFLLWAVAKSQTYWQDPNTGEKYDWSSLTLKNDDYQITDSSEFFVPSVYSFNFGKDLTRDCAGQYPTAMETVEFSDGWMASCSILGRANMQNVKKIPDGIEITYQGGDLCYEVYSMTNRQIGFQLICSKSEGNWEIVQSTYTNYCHIILKKKTLAGCPDEFSFSWTLGLVLLIGGLGAYFVVGICINYRNGNGIKVPHDEFCNRILASFKEFVGGCTDKTKSFIGKEAAGNSKNYEMV